MTSIKYKVAMFSFFCFTLIACTNPISASDDWRWVITTQPGSGQINTFTVSWQSILAGVPNDSSIYKSSDRGVSWAPVLSSLDGEEIFISRLSSEKVMTASSFQSYSDIFLSNNFGSNWDEKTAVPAEICQLMCDSNGIIYAAAKSQNGTDIYSSSDEGDHWSIISSVEDLVWVKSFEEEFTGHIFICGTDSMGMGAIYESASNGNDWTKHTIGPETLPMAVTSIAAIPGISLLASNLNDGNIALCNWNEQIWSVYSHIDAAYNINSLFYSSQGILYAGTKSVDDEEYASIFMSSDRGMTWTEMAMEINMMEIHSFSESEDGFLYASSDFNIMRSEEPIIPPTSTPTTGPGTPTNTPHPPSPTPTDRPPTVTPTPKAPTPRPSTTPGCGSLGISLEVPLSNLYPGDEFFLQANICNTLPYPLDRSPVFVVLQVLDNFWFAPAWTEQLAYYDIDIPEGKTEVTVLPGFFWPENTGHGNATFWAMITDMEIQIPIGSWSYVDISWNEN